MENVVSFSFTLPDLELAEIGGFKVGALTTPSLNNLLYRVQYYEAYSNFESLYVRTFKFNGE